MRRMYKAVFKQPYTSQELAATVEAYLIQPPLPNEWYDVAQLMMDKDGRGLADGWRETLFVDELNE